jgi:hypothetical protein
MKCLLELHFFSFLSFWILFPVSYVLISRLCSSALSVEFPNSQKKLMFEMQKWGMRVLGDLWETMKL